MVQKPKPINFMLMLHLALDFALPVFFLLLTVIAARSEKRMVWQYGDLQAQPPYPDVAGYAGKWVNSALQSGFIQLGWAADPRVPHYRQNYALLVSPERDCFVVAWSGNILKLKSQGITICSPALDGKVYSTSANQQGVQIDLLGHWLTQMASVNAFPQLLERHRDLLRVKNATARHFTGGREIDEFRQLRVERYENMARRGLIVYQDPMNTCWHFTIWGSLRYTFLNFTVGLVRAITHGQIPRCV